MRVKVFVLASLSLLHPSSLLQASGEGQENFNRILSQDNAEKHEAPVASSSSAPSQPIDFEDNPALPPAFSGGFLPSGQVMSLNIEGMLRKFYEYILNKKMPDELVEQIFDYAYGSSISIRPYPLNLNSYRKQITDNTLQALADSFEFRTYLQSLNLKDCSHITSEGLASLQALTRLQSLDLSGCTQLGDLSQLPPLPNLHTLILTGGYNISNTTLIHVARIPNLQELVLDNCWRITDKGLQDLSQSPSLQKLSLANCHNISDIGLASIAILPHLKKLNLAGTFITSAGLDHLKDHKRLEILDLRACRGLDDGCLKPLKSIENLKTLYLTGCINITNEGLNNLKSHCPHLNIYRD